MDALVLVLLVSVGRAAAWFILVWLSWRREHFVLLLLLAVFADEGALLKGRSTEGWRLLPEWAWDTVCPSTFSASSCRQPWQRLLASTTKGRNRRRKTIFAHASIRCRSQCSRISIHVESRRSSTRVGIASELPRPFLPTTTPGSESPPGELTLCFSRERERERERVCVCVCV